jgi:hypothetical protein
MILSETLSLQSTDIEVVIIANNYEIYFHTVFLNSKSSDGNFQRFPSES